MAITYKNGCFKLDTKNTTYCMKNEKYDYIMHEYYGATINDDDLGYIYPYTKRSYVASVKEDEDMLFRQDNVPQEYSAYGIGDFRVTALRIKQADGSRAADLRYVSHEITKGAKIPENLPCATENGFDGISTLKVVLKDSATDIFVNMYYTVYEDTDVITRFNEIVNKSENTVYIEKAASLQLDMRDCADRYDFIQLSGAWARERQIKRTPLHDGLQGYASRRGTTGHQNSTFFCIAEHNTTETYGGAYGFNLVYSGNHRTEIEVDQFGDVRIMSGINDEGFSWQLNPNETFTAPQVVMTYSASGLGEMSRNMHTFVRRHIFRPRWQNRRRPLLINNWEATYCNFNQEILVNLAKTAADLGIEMLVMDDGWFGHREDDKTSLGDWVPYKKRLPGGLKSLADAINATGMKFGLWMEPEMISEDSDLFRAHPDWAMGIPNRERSIGRNQYVLDLVNPEVKNHIINVITDIFENANISYLKWDMNRYLTEAFSQTLGKENQGEVYHRYVLAVYDILDCITKRFPDLLIEHCSGGGGRFDLGMLYYSPQIWTSDDTDPAERIEIQLGSSLGFPITCMGSHVSAVPNHQTDRSAPLSTRANAAYAGTFGYELDINILTDREREEIREQCKFYKKHYDLINNGDYYRLAHKKGEYAAWGFVSSDKKEMLVFYFQLQAGANDPDRLLKIDCAADNLRYTDTETGVTLYGNTLKNVGISIPYEMGERTSICKYFKAE